jgi:hypothetical protein
MQIAPPSVIEKIRSAFREPFEKFQFPTKTLNGSRYALLTVAEDVLRLMFHTNADSWAIPSQVDERHGFVMTLDRCKYDLRQALLLAEQRFSHTEETENIWFGDDECQYSKLFNFIFEIAASQGKISRLLAAVHGDLETLVSSNRKTNSHHSLSNMRDLQYMAFDQYLGAKSQNFAPMPLLANFFLKEGFDHVETEGIYYRGPALKKLIDSVKVRRKRVTYQFVNSRALSLKEFFEHPLELIPENWEFSFGSATLLNSIYISLYTVCLYHVVAVYHGASTKGLRGGGFNDALLVLQKDELIRRLKIISGLPREKVKEICDFLTYGYKTTNPDLALQPLVEMSNQSYAIPCIHLLSSEYERNSLSLQARIDPKRFDRQCRYFEQVMFDDIKKACGDKYRIFTDVSILGEQIDALIFDECGSVLVCEFKWSLRPGDTREVVNRKRAFEKGVSQVERKIDVMNRRRSEINNRNLPDLTDTQFLGAVLTEGYWGHLNPMHEVFPICPLRIATRILNMADTVKNVHKILSGYDWLPRPEIDFAPVYQTLIWKDFNVTQAGLDIKNFGYLTDSLPKYVSEALR